MKQMDADGSGEVDLREFTEWFKSLCEVAPGDTGPSQVKDP